MNPFTGHLQALQSKEELPAKYEWVPSRLQAEATKALAGKQETHVDLRARTPLALWAKKKRREKIAAKSRRRNRK